MSIIRCEIHDRNWDSDFNESCPMCESDQVRTDILSRALDIIYYGHDEDLFNKQEESLK